MEQPDEHLRTSSSSPQSFLAIDGNDDDLERLTKVFVAQADQDEDKQLERCSSSEKIRRTFQKFEEIVASNDHYEVSTRRSTKEHIPYHEMAEVKDKFEKGLLDSHKIRPEKRLDIRVQSGSTSSKKQAFEQGEFEQDSDNQQRKKSPIETDLVAGLTSAAKYAFEQQSNNNTIKSTQIDHDLLVGAAKDKKAKFENGIVQDRAPLSNQPDEIATIVGTGLAHAKRTELLSKIDGDKQRNEYKGREKATDVTAGFANTIKEQYIADLSRSTAVLPAKDIDIETGLAKSRVSVFENPDETTIKRTVQIDAEFLDRGVARERMAMFKNLESGSQASTSNGSSEAKIRVDTTYRWHVHTCQLLNRKIVRDKRLSIRVEFTDTLIRMNVRLKIKSSSLDSTTVIIVEDDGNVVRETDKREEVYFEKGQTRQLVEQWKNKQNSPERDQRDPDLPQQEGKAKNLVQMWKAFDKENTPPLERPGPRPMTPSTEGERRLSSSIDEENPSTSSIYSDEKVLIESGYAKAIRERLLQTAEQTKKSVRQITPPPVSSEEVRRKFSVPVEEIFNQTEYSNQQEDFLPSKGQAKSLKNRFVELEQDALKVETAASKIKYVPKRFVDKPATRAVPAKEKSMENGKNHSFA